MHKASTLRDIMSMDVVTVEPDATLRHVAELFAMEGISGAPVVSDDRVLGVISASDIVEFAASTPGALPDEPVPRRPMTAGAQTGSVVERPTDLARDVMTRGFRSLPAGTEVHAAAEYMLKNGIHRVLVMEGDQLVGLVSTLDFLRALAERRL